MNRRTFVKSLIVGGAGFLIMNDKQHASEQPQSGRSFDKSAAVRELREHRLASIEALYALAAEGLVDVFLLDLGIVGFTRYRHIMPYLKEAGVLASPHTWMWTPRPYYAAQLAAGVGNVVIVEGIPGAADGVDYSAYKFVDGKLIVPDTPGFGLSLET